MGRRPIRPVVHGLRAPLSAAHVAAGLLDRTQRATRRLVAKTVIVMLSLAAARGAAAQCPDPSTSCICGPSPADGVLEGTVLIAIPPLAEFVVEAVHGASGGYAVGDRLALRWRGADAEDLPMLLNLRDGEVVFRQRVTGDGRAVCTGFGFYAPVEDAIAAVLSEDCPQTVRHLGLEPGACEGGPSAPSDAGGCAAVEGVLNDLALLATVIGLAASRRRNDARPARRSPPRSKTRAAATRAPVR